MIKRQQAAGLLATLALLVAAPAQAQPVIRNTVEVAELILVMHREPLAVYSYAQLYEACTQKKPSPEFNVVPNDPGQLHRVILELATEWQLVPEAEANELALQCKRRMMKLMGPRGRYYTPVEAKEWNTGSAFDPGLILARLDGQWVVREAIASSPAAAAGLQPGDVLVSLDGLPLAGMGASELFGLLRHPAAMPVQLVSQRPGEPSQSRSIARAPTVQDQTVVVGQAPGHFYIRLAGFFEDTPVRLMKGLRGQPTDSSGVRVLDLRGNPGGRLVNVQWVLALLGKHSKAGAWHAVQHRPGSDLARPFSATESMNAVKGLDSTGVIELREWLVSGKWVVLVDGETGSGAAWLASALRELNGAVLVGQPPDASDFGIDVLERVKEGRGTAGIRYEIGLLGLPSGKALAPDNAQPDIVLPRTAIKPFPKSVADWLQDPVYLQIQAQMK